MKKYLKLHEVRLSEGSNTSKIQIFKKGTFDHAYYGVMEFNDEVFASFIKNFDDRVRGIDIQANFGHSSWSEAAGWVQRIFQEGEKLYADIEWTEDAAEAIRAKKWKYISPEFDLNYKDAESGKVYGETVIGVALTNIPFLKGMDAVSSLHELDEEQINRVMELVTKEKDDTMKFEELLEALKKLNEEEKGKVASALGVSAPASTDGDKALSEENEKLKAELAKKDREIEFSEMLANEQVAPAQKDAYMSGDMKKFAELAVKVNLDEDGSEETPADDDVTDGDEDGDEEKEVEAKDFADAQNKIHKLAEKMVDEKKITYHEAVRKVLRDNPKLATKYAA